MQQRIMPLLDNGHGKTTPGKRSPVWADGTQLFEWSFNRDVVKRISDGLKSCNIKHCILVEEKDDISLQERCRRANEYQHMYNNCVLFSIHGNAGGGTGWECYTSKGTTKADEIATLLYEEAEKEFAGWKIRKDFADGDADKEANFYILKHTVCPAVLTENFFMDNEKDCKLMLSEDGRERIAKIHINVIKKLAWGK